MPHPPRRPPACLGAEVYRVDARTSGRPWPTVCIAVGGVVRVENLGPDGMTADAADRISCFYADAFDGGPPWGAVCLRKAAGLRVENLGPGDFDVAPRSAVSCYYEAAVRECRFVTTGTVTFTTMHPQETRQLIVVVVA